MYPVIPNFFYPLGFFLATVGLLLWAFYDKNKRVARLAQVAVIVGFGMYLFSLTTSEVSFKRMLFMGFRDLVILAVINWVMMLLKPKTIVFWCLLLSFFALFQYFASAPMEASLTVKRIEKIDVDKAGEWLVELKSNADLDILRLRLKGLAEIRQAFEPKDRNTTSLDEYLVVDVLDNEEASVQKVAKILKKSGQTNWIEPNEIIQLEPYFLESKKSLKQVELGVDDPMQNQQWAMKALNMKAYYAFLRKQQITIKKKVKLAILDTGIDARHEDLVANFVSIEKKYDNDPQGHGTHCAGVAGAVTNNGIGIASLNFGNGFYAITSVKVLNPNGMGTQETIIDGIIKAADSGVAVISMSLGGRVGKRKQKAYEKAVKYANKKGAIVVVAAGNANRNATGVSPANVSGVITVTAIDSTFSKALFSNSIEDLDMGIAAPGVAIYSTIPNNQYTFFNGTSVATPFVAGLVAMMKAIKPRLKTKEIYQILNETGMETRNQKSTGSLVLPEKALRRVLEF